MVSLYKMTVSKVVLRLVQTRVRHGTCAGRNVVRAVEIDSVDEFPAPGEPEPKYRVGKVYSS